MFRRFMQNLSHVGARGEVRRSEKLFGIILSGPRMSAENLHAHPSDVPTHTARAIVARSKCARPWMSSWNVLEFHFLWQLPVLFCFWGQSGDTVITDPWKCQTSGNQLTSSISPFDLSLLVCRFRAARRAPWPAPHPRPPHRASTHGNASLASTSGT